MRDEKPGPDPELPLSDLLPLASDPDDNVRRGVTLTEVRAQIAGRQDLPPHLLEVLAVHHDGAIRQAVASNNSTPSPLLVMLAKDPEADVRKEVAINNNTPPGVLAVLAEDKAAIVQFYVAQNSNTPLAALERLATRPIPPDATLEELSLSLPDLVPSLQQAGITTLLALVQKTEEDLRRLPGMNKRGLREIHKVASFYDLSLGMPPGTAKMAFKHIRGEDHPKEPEPDQYEIWQPLRGRGDTVEDMEKLLEAAGTNILRIPSELRETFEQLPLHGVSVGELVLPHHTLYLQYPKGHTFLGVFISQARGEEGAFGLLDTGDATFHGLLLVVCYRETADAPFAIRDIEIPLRTGTGDLEERLLQALPTPDPNERSALEVSLLTATQRMGRLLINTLLYWTSPHANVDVQEDDPNAERRNGLRKLIKDTKNPQKRKALRNKITDMCSLVHVHTLRAPVSPPDASPPGDRGPVRRHKVMAHWSHYWVSPQHPLWEHGTGDGDRRRIRKLVMEHWRGVTAAGRITQRLYQVVNRPS